MLENMTLLQCPMSNFNRISNRRGVVFSPQARGTLLPAIQPFGKTSCYGSRCLAEVKLSDLVKSSYDVVDLVMENPPIEFIKVYGIQ